MAATALNRLLTVLLLALALPWLAGCDDEQSDEMARVRINGVAFPSASLIQFVMRDCLVPIDIAFLDAAGRVVAMHEMTPEEPRREGESELAYERRLKTYPSRFPAQFAVETAGGRLREVGLEVGQRVEFDLERLKNLVR